MTEELEGLTNSDEPPTETETVEGLVAKLKASEAEAKNLRDGNSRFGREFKLFKDETAKGNAELREMIAEMAQNRIAPAGNEEIDIYEDEDVKKYKQIARHEAKIEREEAERSIQKLRTKYVDDYTKATQEMGGNEEVAVYEQILSEMEALPGYSDDGSADARINYQIAERNYYKRMYNTPKESTTFLKEEKPAGGVGGSSTVETKEGTDAEVQAALKDPHVQEYMRRRNKDDEFVKKAMKNKTPMSGTMRL